MSGTLLEIVQDAMGEAGFRRPTSVAGNPNDESQTLLTLANRAVNEILKAKPWQINQVEDSITLVLGQQEYDIPADMLFYSPETMWNRDTRRPVLMALSPQEWQYYKGWIFIQGLNLRGRIQGDKFIFEQPVDSTIAGNNIFFEYRSFSGVTDAGGTPKAKFTADDDLSRYDRDLVSQSVLWRLLRQRGLDDWADVRREYNVQLRTFMGNENAARKVSLAGPRMPFIGVNVPDGNFAGFP